MELVEGKTLAELIPPRGFPLPQFLKIAAPLADAIGAGLFTTSLANLRGLDSGFRTEGLRWSRLFAVPGGYHNQTDAVYYPELVRQLSSLPGIQSVALSH